MLSLSRRGRYSPPPAIAPGRIRPDSYATTTDFVAITARLGGGTIQVNGVMRHTSSPELLAVTGGTGSYANARGTLQLDESTARATFSLLP
jgi:hypothetical protein